MAPSTKPDIYLEVDWTWAQAVVQNTVRRKGRCHINYNTRQMQLENWENAILKIRQSLDMRFLRYVSRQTDMLITILHSQTQSKNIRRTMWFEWAYSMAHEHNSVPKHAIYTVTQKNNQFSFVCTFFNTWQKLGNCFTYVKESVSYNSVYLVLARVKNFA